MTDNLSKEIRERIELMLWEVVKKNHNPETIDRIHLCGTLPQQAQALTRFVEEQKDKWAMDEYYKRNALSFEKYAEMKGYIPMERERNAKEDMLESCEKHGIFVSRALLDAELKKGG